MTLPRKEVAVDGLETGVPGILDPRYATSTASARRPTRSSTVVRLAVTRKRASGSSELAGRRLGLAKQLDRRVRVGAPGDGDAERRRRVDLLVAGGRAAGAGDLDGLARERCASEKSPSSIDIWASEASDRGPLRASARGG